MKKRILQFIGSFHQGGTERQATALTRELKQDGIFEVYAAAFSKEGILRDSILALDLPEIPEYPLTSFFDLNFVRQARRCADHLRENKIDLIHTHDFYTNVFGMTAAVMTNVPARVVSEPGTGGMRAWAQRFVEKQAFKRANVVLANCEAVRDHLNGNGVSSDKIRVIYNGLDNDRFAGVGETELTSLERFGLPADATIVTLVANLRHGVKNVPMLIRAASRAIKTHVGTHFVIAGEVELENELRSQADELGISKNIHFIGRCDDVPMLLAASDICVLTSTAEGFSNAIIEYMAAGKPVVATNVGGAAEAVINGETGYLVPSDDDEAMADRLIALLDDDKKASQFGALGKRIAHEKFSRETQLAGTTELYKSLLNRD